MSIKSKDELTGLYTRHSFQQALDEAISHHKQLAVAVLDVNRFFDINEEYGHAVGDKVLAELGQMLSATAAVAGWEAGRIGGDEFALLMPECSLEQAFLQMEKLRQRIAGPEFIAQLADMCNMTSFGVAIGVASYPRDARNAGALMRMADEALYSAKENGRNCVALPSNQEMVLKSSHYTATQLRRLKELAEKQQEKESVLLREALDDLLNKYDVK